MIGFLIFSIVETRPDIAFFIVVATCFAKNPSHTYIKVVKTILKYLKEFMNCGIIYEGKGQTFSIKSYLDSN